VSILKKIRTRDYKGWIHEGLEWTPSNPAGEEFQKMLSEKGELLLTCQGRDIYRLSFDLEGIPCGCFLYLFRNTSHSRALKRPYAYQILRISQRIRSLGFPSFKVLAALRPKNELLNWNSLLIAQEIPNVKELQATGNHVYQVHASIPFSGRITDIVAEELARFHTAGLIHGDLKSRHILISKNQDRVNPEICFVDLEKTRYYRILPSVLRDLFSARDIIQLLSSLPDECGVTSGQGEKARFLSLYLKRRNLGERKSKRIRKAVSLYLDSDSLRQGETLLQGIIRKIRGRAAGKKKAGNPSAD
jgi:Lipopolysaccharide kinase (Kdo/WaaP) family